MKRSKLVMVGNGMAGMRALEELLKVAPGLCDVAVFGAEPHPNYAPDAYDARQPKGKAS